MSSKNAVARLICAYELFGDTEGREWMETRLLKLLDQKEIDRFEIFTVSRGVWGIQYVLFSVDVLVHSEISHEDVRILTLPALNRAVGDSDVEILWVGEASESTLLKEPA